MKKLIEWSVFFCLSLTLSATSHASRKVAIIGGGMSGVAALSHLSRFGNDPNLEIHLFEMQERLGGNASTQFLENSDGELVPVDFGAQFFSEGGWDKYIQLQKDYDLFDEEVDLANVSVGLIIGEENSKRSYLETPSRSLRFISVRNVKKLLVLKKFLKYSRQFYVEKRKSKERVTVEDFLSELPDIKEKDKRNIILPFLSSILGTPMEETKKLSFFSLTHLVSFRPVHPLGKTDYQVPLIGMGGVVEKIAMLEKAKSSYPIHFHLSTFVKSVVYKREKDVYEISYNEKDLAEFDYVIMTTHASQTADILIEAEQELKDDLKSLPYITLRTVVHYDKDSSLILGHPSHHLYNIAVNPKRGEVYNTINLEKIHPMYKGMFRTVVLNDDVYDKISGEKFSVEFHHPLVTPFFLEKSKMIKQSIKDKKYPHLGPRLTLAGGWTKEHETQETAIISAEEALEELSLVE